MDVIAEAGERGYQLDRRRWHGQPVWARRRGDDRRHPMFVSEPEALVYMADRLRRIVIFGG